MGKENRYAVILAGGRGARFWPLSRKEMPKQFIRITGTVTLLEMALDRIRPLVPDENILVLTNRLTADLLTKILPSFPAHNVIAEPVMRDTAGAIGLAAGIVRARAGDAATLAVLSSDHLITPVGRFVELMRFGFGLAELAPEYLYTFGIRPTYPAESFGYLERGAKIDVAGPGAVHDLRSFREKPDKAAAEALLASGNFRWNAGIFVWNVGTVLAAFDKHLPRNGALLASFCEAEKNGRLAKVLNAEFEKLEKISIDFGIMEKYEKVRMIDADFEWKDVGGYLALGELYDAANVGRANCPTFAIESGGNVVSAPDGHLVAMLGVSELVVAVTGDATLVCRKDRLEDVRRLVVEMEKDPRYAKYL